MRDPFRALAPKPLEALSVPLARALNLPALPLHAHEVLFAITFYAFLAQVVSPAVSRRVVPSRYALMDRRSRISWNVHVVSFVQSCVVNALSLYIICCDEERQSWRGADAWELRIWGYTGFIGLTQSLALGYFLWDLYMCVRHVHIFGWGMVAHAVASSAMFTLGFRPFIHFYCPVFLLHELSTPFLNVHWFCDKLGLTGSIYQAVNGGFLIVTFFACRLVWGAYGSWGVSQDIYRAIFSDSYITSDASSEKIANSLRQVSLMGAVIPDTASPQDRRLPLWLGVSYLLSNLILTLLNMFWFSKMIETIRKRFDPPMGTRKAGAAANERKDK
ncbi:hypothetical protein SMMN14_00310 [Sphaerulina musiva]